MNGPANAFAAMTLIALAICPAAAAANPTRDGIVAFVDAGHDTKNVQTGETERRGTVGSGMLVSTEGHIAVAYHVIAAWDSLSRREKQENPITVRFSRSASYAGNLYEARNLVIAKPKADFAILKITEAFTSGAFATPCLLAQPHGTALTAAGYPSGAGGERTYSPVSFGSADAGVWTVTSDIGRGMSGGPVFLADTLKVVGFVTSGVPTKAVISHVTPIATVADAFEYALGAKVLDCRDAPKYAGSGSYSLTVWREDHRVERRVTRHGLGGFKGRNREIDRAVRPSPGWSIDIDESQRGAFRLIKGGADNGRCEGWRWNTLSSNSVTMYARVDQTQHLVPRDAHVNCSAEIPEIRTVTETIEDTLSNAAIPFDDDTVIELPPNVTEWRLEVTNPRGKRQVFSGPKVGRDVDISADARQIIISPN